MIDSDIQKTKTLDEVFKSLTGAEKKFVLAYIESKFDKMEAVKATLKPDKEYNSDYYRLKAHNYLHKQSIQEFLNIYFDNLKSEHSAKVQQLLDYLTEKAFDDSEDADTGTKRQSLDILSKYLLNPDLKIDITSKGESLNNIVFTLKDKFIKKQQSE